jgi:hypothetical protein
MDGTKAQAKVYRGYSIAASKIGTAYTQYRPVSADLTGLAPISTSLLASFNSEDMTYSRPNKYAKPTWYALVDGTQTQVGDYLIGAAGTFFIAAQQPLLPILAVECNRVLSFARPQTQAQFGAVTNYEGNTPDTQTPLAAGWHASVLQGTKGEKNDVGLPGDVRNAWWAILLPAIPGVILQSGDLVTDDIDRRYVLSSVELTDLGYRCTAQQAQT